MDKQLFKNILKPQIDARTFKNETETGEAIAKAYDKALKSRAFSQSGQKFLSSNISILETSLKQGFKLNSLTKKKSSDLEPGWSTMALGFFMYWTGAKFNLVPPFPPAASTTNVIVTFPGNAEELAKKLKIAFNQDTVDDFIEILSSVLINFQSKITGQYIGVSANGVPVSIPWIGVFGDKPQENKKHEVIIDSKMTFKESVSGIEFPKDILNSLILLDIDYISSDNKLHRGQIVVNKSVQKEVEEFFKILLEEKFPIKKMIPVVKYGWIDTKSMEDNNTSGFNYRVIAGSKKMSKHSFGMAIDVNPKWNPVVYANGNVEPPGSKRNELQPGTLTSNNPAVKYLKSKGWNWGGDYRSFKDWHHFDKE